MAIQNFIKMKDMKVHYAFILLFVIIFSVNALAASPEWPKKVSELNGWQGFKLVKGKRCPPCYSLIFPKYFGLHSEEEFPLLINLPKKRIGMEYDLDGPLFDDVDVLDQLLYLALEKQLAKAAKVILYPEKYSLLLGVETSEEIVGEVIIPLLRTYYDLNEIIKESEYETIGKWVSGWSAYKADFRISDKLVGELMSRNYKKLAETIYRKCKKEKDLMKKNGEKFINGEGVNNSV